MTLSISFSDDERQLVNRYAEIHSISVAEAFKRVLLEKIEDEFDVVIADEAYR